MSRKFYKELIAQANYLPTDELVEAVSKAHAALADVPLVDRAFAALYRPKPRKTPNLPPLPKEWGQGPTEPPPDPGEPPPLPMEDDQT